MAPCIPDVPYKIQGIFIAVFSYIWTTAFIDDYDAPYPEDKGLETIILVLHNKIKLIK